MSDAAPKTTGAVPPSTIEELGKKLVVLGKYTKWAAEEHIMLLITILISEGYVDADRADELEEALKHFPVHASNFAKKMIDADQPIEKRKASSIFAAMAEADAKAKAKAEAEAKKKAEKGTESKSE